MIYKCKNCGTEYNIPTDYCDCGNNTFDIIGEESDVVTSQSNVSDEYDEYGEKITKEPTKISPENNSDLELLYQPDFKYTKKEKKETNENKKQWLPVVLFVISLLISGFLIIYAFLSKPADNKKGEISNVQTERIEPKKVDINDFWEDAPISTEQKKNENADLNKQKAVQTQSAPKTEKQNQTKNIQSQKPVQSNKSAPVQKSEKTSKPPKTTENKTQKVVKQPQKVEEENKTVQKPVQNTKPEQKKETKPAVSKEDIAKLNTYKANLREYLFAAFPILTVQGSGTASVGFSISSEGKLLNRRFVSQSDNKSLNDAMYHMLMKTPSYSAPPSLYKGEEIILEMKFNNGHYSFSYLK